MASLAEKTVRLDGIKWWIPTTTKRRPVPICPKHHLRMRPVPVPNPYGQTLLLSTREEASRTLKCAECDSVWELPRKLSEERRYILDKVDARIFKGMETLNIDDEVVPLAKTEKIRSADGKYWARGHLVESKVGKRFVVYAGERGKDSKVQLFAEPEIKRLSFDQNDTHPSDVFVKVEATFEDGTNVMMEKEK